MKKIEKREFSNYFTEYITEVLLKNPDIDVTTIKVDLRLKTLKPRHALTTQSIQVSEVGKRKRNNFGGMESGRYHGRCEERTQRGHPNFESTRIVFIISISLKFRILRRTPNLLFLGKDLDFGNILVLHSIYSLRKTKTKLKTKDIIAKQVTNF